MTRLRSSALSLGSANLPSTSSMSSMSSRLLIQVRYQSTHLDTCKPVTGLNGESSITVELALKNPPCPGCGTSVDISIIPPLSWNRVSTGFRCHNGRWSRSELSRPRLQHCFPRIQRQLGSNPTPEQRPVAFCM
ncbi:hypothetical protein BDN72DRAFT_300391 [Pluteus cervinus]|uniref:Uncharacterized protein n=1 Tax=Pluteus cervinus TaxID=181527 RepID=A0ACD3ADV5_9AGAR|nr:hypothetical protein BDN72DRAFT_300391 [Pluteus cervinus]